MTSGVSVRAVNRSTISNDPRRLSADADMRLPDARLFADCFDQLAAEFPDVKPLKLREVALLKFAVEKAVAIGNWEDVVRLHNLIARKEAPLRAQKRAVQVGGSQGLAEYLAKRQAETEKPETEKRGALP